MTQILGAPSAAIIKDRKPSSNQNQSQESIYILNDVLITGAPKGFKITFFPCPKRDRLNGILMI